MDTAVWIELFGYFGSVLVVISMLMVSVVKLRIINGIGSVISATYALVIGSFPLALMNGCLIVINGYNLYKLLKSDRHFDLVEGTQNDPFLAYFLNRYQADIARYFPEFKGECESNAAYLVCCEGEPAGVLLGNRDEEGCLDIRLDYSVPAYRDCSVGKYLYAKLSEKGIRALHFVGMGSEAHASYLTRMGFVEEKGIYRKELN